MPDSRLLPPIPSTQPARAVVLSDDDPAAMVSLQERLLERALAADASDLHVEPTAEHVRLRLRIDGWLHELDPLPSWMHRGLVSRFKVMAGMDVTERRRPQDGRHVFRPKSGAAVDLRVATAPTQHGEKVTIRLLPRSRRPPALGDLGLDRRRRDRLRDFISRPYGLILATGPTGAGKTTTLHALLRTVDAVGRSVVTLEDPIEYDLPGASQIPVRPAIGVDFAAGLRAILRHDPDVVLLGEIRDEETARVAVRSATTGHLVLSSVHTNSAAESVHRLFDLGVPPYLVAGALCGVVAQRLVRRLCRRCRAPAPASAELPARFGLEPLRRDHRSFDAVGCSACRGGFTGRVGIFETLTISAHVRSRLAEGAGCLDLSREALARGDLLPLREAAAAVWRRGETTAEELARVLPPAVDDLSRTAPDAAPGRASGPAPR